MTLVQRTSTYIMTNKEGMPRLMKGAYISTMSASLQLTSAPRHVLGGRPAD